MLALLDLIIYLHWLFNYFFIFGNNFSLEFEFCRVDVTEIKSLLERAVFYLDSIVAKVAYNLEQKRANEEQKSLSALGDNVDPEEVFNIRSEIHHKYNKIKDEILSPILFLLLGHYQLLLGKYDDSLSAYKEYKRLAPAMGLRNLSYLYGYAFCVMHVGAYNT